MDKSVYLHEEALALLQNTWVQSQPYNIWKFSTSIRIQSGTKQTYKMVDMSLTPMAQSFPWYLHKVHKLYSTEQATAKEMSRCYSDH